MLTEFSWVFVQPTELSAPLAFSCAFFFGLYGPPYASERIQSGACLPQSLYGTPSRPTVQSRRGSSDIAADDVQEYGTFTCGQVAASSPLMLFHAPDGETAWPAGVVVIASGRPLTGSVWNRFTKVNDGWWKPQQPK